MCDTLWNCDDERQHFTMCQNQSLYQSVSQSVTGRQLRSKWMISYWQSRLVAHAHCDTTIWRLSVSEWVNKWMCRLTGWVRYLITLSHDITKSHHLPRRWLEDICERRLWTRSRNHMLLYMLPMMNWWGRLDCRMCLIGESLEATTVWSHKIVVLFVAKQAKVTINRTPNTAAMSIAGWHMPPRAPAGRTERGWGNYLQQ